MVGDHIRGHREGEIIAMPRDARVIDNVDLRLHTYKGHPPEVFLEKYFLLPGSMMNFGEDLNGAAVLSSLLLPSSTLWLRSSIDWLSALDRFGIYFSIDS
ncbi:unnamed protein product, partial [Nesidiocoris tenuis]